MAGIDESLSFHPLHIAILTVSDTRTMKTDKSGALLMERAETAGHVVVERRIITDDLPALTHQLQAWVNRSDVEVILTTGGTGVTGRDSTPEAVEAVCENVWIALNSFDAVLVTKRIVVNIEKRNRTTALL